MKLKKLTPLVVLTVLASATVCRFAANIDVASSLNPRQLANLMALTDTECPHCNRILGEVDNLAPPESGLDCSYAECPRECIWDAEGVAGLKALGFINIKVEGNGSLTLPGARECHYAGRNQGSTCSPITCIDLVNAHYKNNNH